MERQDNGQRIDALAERVRRGERLKVDELLALMSALIAEHKNRGPAA